MEQPTIAELARVRAWLEGLRQDPAFTVPGATFSLGPGVVPLYGVAQRGHLSSDRGLLEYVIAFANAKPCELFPPLPESVDADIRSAQRIEMESIENRQALFVPLLDTVASDRKRAAAQFLLAVKQLMSTHVWALPDVGGSDHHYVINDDAGLYSYVAKLLLEESRGFDLRRCEKCRRLFLVRPTAGRGRPQKRFCDSECAKATHDGQSGQRRRRSRARQLLERRHGRENSRKAVQRAFEVHPEGTVKELAEHAKLLMNGARKHK